MAFSDENLTRLKRHFARLGVVPRCPVCGNNVLSAQGVEAANYVDPETMVATLGGPLPVLGLVRLGCTRCFYVMSFVWGSIKETTGAQRDG